MTDVTRKDLAAAACLAAMLLAGPVPLASAEEPVGIALEGFPYLYPVHMFVISRGGETLNMAYMDVMPACPPNGRTVLLLHGRNFPSIYWRQTIEALTAAGYRVVAPVPGEQLIDQEDEVTPESYRSWMMKAYEVTLPPSALDPYVAARTRIRGSAEFPRWLVSFADSYQMIWREPVADEIPPLTQPVLFLIGENDHVAPGRNFAPEDRRAAMGQNALLAKELAAMQDASVNVFQGVGHLIQLEAPQKFNEAVLQFLNAQD
jgi:pimeloyl-ACP methyl ester carboxylesterase